MLSRYALGAIVGALVLYAALPQKVISYPEVIVPAARIIEREPPTEVRWRDRIVYRYVTPDVRATAPGGALDDVARFCRPLVVASTDTVRIGTPSVIRSVVYNPSLVPLRKDRLLVTSMNGYGDLFAEDYRVRPGYSVSFESGVRYSRLAPLREIGEGALWYLTFRAAEAILIR